MRRYPPHWQHGPQPWWEGRRHKRRFLMGRFAFFLFVLMVLFFGGLAIVLWLAGVPLDSVLWRPPVLLAALCAVPVLFLMLMSVFGGFVFRRFGTPIVDVMAAADAVADGDLTVRVREEVPGQMGQLGRSFNRMTAELQRAEQQRRNLTADVAHELRTPLHIIQGNLEGILDGVYEPSAEHITATLEETRLLARLVTDLQTLSLAEAGQLPLHLERIAAADLLADVVTSFAGQAAAAGIRLEAQAADNAENLEIEVDPDRMEQVLSNLMANAIRHTPQGGQISLTAQRFSTEDKRQGIRLTVSDSGAGIAPEDLPFIFDRFWKGDRSRTHKEGAGSGLGLAIARQLVQAHGGKIDVSSRPGEGTQFVIDLFV